MTTVAKRMIDGSQMSGSSAIYYTAPASTKAVIKKLTLCNTTVNAVPCTVSLVPSAGIADAANTIISGRVLSSGETWICSEAENMVLEAGGTISASGTNVTIMCSGVEIS